MQGSHTHIPETNHVPRGYIVAAILSLLFMVPLCLVPALVLLFVYVSTSRSIIIIIIITAIEFSLDGNSPYTGTDKTNKNKRNNTKHSRNKTKHSKYKYTYYQNTHNIVQKHTHITKQTHIHTPTHYKTS